MSEHVHDMKWHTSSDAPYIQWYCADACGYVIEIDEIERRLNATEKLSAAKALFAASFVGASSGIAATHLVHMLDAYASVLDGEDGDEKDTVA